MSAPAPVPPALRAYLPASTIAAWEKLAPIVPSSAYLAGGTGLTVHLLHRVSRDLDLMVAGEEDFASLLERLRRVGKFAVTLSDDDTLNGVLDDTKVQFLRVRDQHQIAPTTTIGGIRVASIEDIAAMKLKVVLDRGELRDYFDLMEIDRRGHVRAEEGIALFMRRYGLGHDDQRVMMVVRSLGYLEDVADDPALPLERSLIEDYWARRQPDLVRSLGRR